MEGQLTGVPPGASGEGYAVAPSSPSGQKRSRDYVEELKGLTSDEDGDGSFSPHTSKKKKTDHPGSDSASEESLDDGEIVEPSSSRPDSSHDAEIQPELAALDIQSADPSTTETDGLAGSAQQPVVGFNRGVSLGMRTSFGKGAKTPFSIARSINASANTLAEIALGLSSPSTSTHGEETNQEQQRADGVSQPEASVQDEAQQVAPESDSSSLSFSCGKTIWQIPRLEALDIPEIPEAQNEQFWRQRISSFIITLFRANNDSWDRLDVKSLRTALEKYVSKDGGFLRGSNKHTKAVRKALQQATANKQWLTSLIQKARETAQVGNQFEPTERKVPEQGNIPADEERRQQHRYFPNADDPSQYCISCSRAGHGVGDCPQLSCRFCESSSHYSLRCPTRQRCIKCRQLGHGRATCREKLALSVDEQNPCAFCGAEHLEDDCSEVWRSYDPAHATIKKVKDIPAFCYTCGNEGHYGPECALPGRGSKVTGRTSWSQANRDLYVDSQSDVVAIGLVGIPEEGLNGSSGLQIRGRATRSAHTHFVSDDESDDGFIREPVKKSQQPRGQMRIATNIANGPQNGARGRPRRDNQSRRHQQEPEFEPPPPPPQDVLEPSRYSGNGSWQPPLPPGPPPPMQVNGVQGSTTSSSGARPGSLPPRPGTFSQGNGRGQPPRSQSGRGGRGYYRGGRGGRRGNSRGRGQ